MFFLAFAGIVGLFALKRWESAHAKVFLPGIRYSADEQARRLKVLLLAGTRDLEKLPPFLLRLASLIVRVLAIAFGHLAHWIGERSHALADLVSYKHRFERKETRSEFLKQVIEHPITNRNGNHVEPALVAQPTFTPPPAPEKPEERVETVVDGNIIAVERPKRSRLSRFGIKDRRKKSRSREEGTGGPPSASLER